jgi:beta-lactamase class C
MRQIKSAFWIAAAISAIPALAAAAPSARETDAKFERFAAAVAGSEHIVGLAVAVVRDGQPTLIRTYGPRELGGSEPIDPQTIFRVASLSKGFATGLVAQLVAEGKLKLDAPAAAYAPDLELKDPRQLAKVTLENVMSHRLGLPPNAYDNLLEAGLSPARILRRLDEVKPICKVGECYGYQNVAFNILADAIEAADGRPVDQSMAARIFQPLGMNTASLGLEGLKVTGNWARPHRRRKGKSWRLVPVRERYYRLPAAAGINASIKDMTRWLAAQMGSAPEVLSPEMLSMLHKPRVETPGQKHRIRNFLTVKSAHYGLGWRIYDFEGETVISHTGSVDGYATQIAFLPDRKAGVVLLCNSRSQSFYTLAPAFLRLELGLEAFPVRAAASQHAEHKAISGGGGGPM